MTNKTKKLQTTKQRFRDLKRRRLILGTDLNLGPLFPVLTATPRVTKIDNKKLEDFRIEELMVGLFTTTRKDSVMGDKFRNG